ncbi:MAG: Eco57I restriction-modification methylase domain-containing protein, partial [Thermoguttaceae bacterium]
NTLCQSATGEWRLTLTERKRILLNNIYGVDLDAQAVEVTKLSLSLCVLEGFNDEALQSNLRLFYDRALPNLSENIRCGNSLIGPDFYDQCQGTLFDLEEQLTINAFDWRDPVHGFGTILKNGGFDAVIGNPPYVSAVNHQASAPEQREYLTHSKDYRTLYQKWDLYLPFLEKGLRVLAENGYMAMIIPYPFINQIYAKLMREEILREHTLLSIADGSGVRVFRNAVVTNCIPLIAKKKTSAPIQILSIEGETVVPTFTKTASELVQNEKTAVWDLTRKKNFTHDYSQWHTLGDYCYISKGMVLNADEKKAPGKFKKDDLISETEDEIHCKKYMEGKDVDRYKINRIRFLEWGTKRVPSLVSRPTFPELYVCKKLMINKLGTIKATLDDGQSINHNHTIHAAVLWCDLKSVENASINNSVKRYSNYKREELERFSENIDLHYLLGILNSKYANVLLAQIRGDDFNIYPEHLKKIPIRPIDFTNPTEKAQHDHIVQAVTELLALNRRLQTETFFNPQERIVLERRAASLDLQIDDLVFDLYGLTPEERALCE